MVRQRRHRYDGAPLRADIAARMVKLVDTRDLKSLALAACRFDSGSGHQRSAVVAARQHCYKQVAKTRNAPKINGVFWSQLMGLAVSGKITLQLVQNTVPDGLRRPGHRLQ